MIYLEKKQVPAHLLAGYTGSKLKAEPCESVSIPFDAGLWDSGSRSHYSAIELATGREIAIPGQSSAPWDETRRERKVTLQPGFAIVCHRMFCGTDMGLTFYVHPNDVAALLPATHTEALSPVELKYLAITRAYKSQFRAENRARAGISETEAEAIKAKLIRDGYLNKAGALTVQGRNACQNVEAY